MDRTKRARQLLRDSRDGDPRDAELANLQGVIEEVGASYPLLVYLPDADQQPEEFDAQTSLDPLIFNGLVRP